MEIPVGHEPGPRSADLDEAWAEPRHILGPGRALRPNMNVVSGSVLGNLIFDSEMLFRNEVPTLATKEAPESRMLTRISAILLASRGHCYPETELGFRRE